MSATKQEVCNTSVYENPTNCQEFHENNESLKVVRDYLCDLALSYVTDTDIEITASDKGLILHAENGNRYRLGVSNHGSLVTEEI